MGNFIAVCLLILPWVFLPIKGITNQFRLPQAIFMDFMFMGIIVCGLLREGKPYRNKYLGYLVGFIFYTFLANFFLSLGIEYNILQTTTAQVIPYRNLAMWQIEPFVHFILGLFATFMILTRLETRDFYRINKTICLSAVLVALFAILQKIGLDPLKSIARYVCDNRISACLDNPNLVGGYLAICSPFFFTFIHDWRAILGYLIVIVGIAITLSYSSILCVLASIIILLTILLRRRVAVLISGYTVLVFGVLLLFMMFPQKIDKLMSGRWETWVYAFGKFKDNILFGQGLGKFKTIPTYVNSTPWVEAHNDWIQMLVEIGLVGTVLFAILVIRTIFRSRTYDPYKVSYLTSFITFLLLMGVGFPLEVPALATIGLMGFLGVENDKQRIERKNPP